MIGVFLGFVVSSWSESRQRSKQADLLVESLRQEMEQNADYLKKVIDYHEMLRDSSQYYAYEDVDIKKPTFFKGTMVKKMTNSAYTTAIQTGLINELPIAKIQAINALYTLQQDYDDYSQVMMANLINKNFTEKADDIRNIARFLSLTMTDIVIKERELLNGYQNIQQDLK